MIKTALFLLCTVVILVSGTNDASEITKQSAENGSSSTSNIITIPVPTSSSTTVQTPTSTSATTVSPNSTTQVPPTTPSPSPTPKPTPDPATGEWVVNGTKHVCIRARMALQFVVSYNTTDKKVIKKSVNLPVNASVYGKCDSEADMEQSITLLWETAESEMLNNLTLHFLKNITQARYALHHLEVNFSQKEFPWIGVNSTNFVHESDEFTAKLNNSYRCLKVQTLKLTSNDNATSGEIKISNLQLQAFHNQDTESFGFAEDCAFDTPDIVPIAVGCALASLVVIVLVAYLVGRRRSQARGYRSM